jgi:hypothetical protein
MSDPAALLVKAGLLDADQALDLDVAAQRLVARVELGELSFEQATRVLTNHYKRACDAFVTTHGPLTVEQQAASDRVIELVAHLIGVEP